MVPSYNKFWAPYDEGFILEASYMVNKGMVPYRDFFILMYPPGQIYAIAALLKLFGMNLLAPRIYTLLMQAVICTSVFYIAKKITSFKFAMIGFILCLSALASAGRPVPRPMWPGIALSLISVSFMINFINGDKIRNLLASGFFVGLALIFRHDIGVLTLLAGSIGLLMLKRGLKSWVLYGFFPALFIVSLSIWLYRVNALSEAFQSLLMFPKEFCKGGAIPFPGFCFNFNMILHRGCYFIKKNQFYIPIVVSAVSAGLIWLELIVKKELNKKMITLIMLFCLGIFYLQQVIVRTDAPHLAAAFPISSILFTAMFSYEARYRNRIFKAIKVLAISFVSLLMALYFYKNVESHFKDVYGKAFIKKTIKPTAFKQGTLYVPDDGRDAFLALIKYVEENTAEGEKIYMGNLNHSVPQYGWYELIYFLTERLPAVRYYEIHPGLQDREDIQREMIESLKENKTKTLLLRDYESNEAPLGPLDKFIRKEYKLDTLIDTYHIYVKQQ